MVVVLDLIKKVFIIYKAYLEAKMLIYLTCKAQIVLLVVEKVTIPIKYLDFIDIFSKKLAVKFLEKLKINKYIINLKSNK